MVTFKGYGIGPRFGSTFAGPSTRRYGFKFAGIAGIQNMPNAPNQPNFFRPRFGSTFARPSTRRYGFKFAGIAGIQNMPNAPNQPNFYSIRYTRMLYNIVAHLEFLKDKLSPQASRFITRAIENIKLALALKS